MGRPKLYHTEEEKKAADRAKSKRHYHKNKADIKITRKATYQPRQSILTHIVQQSAKSERPIIHYLAPSAAVVPTHITPRVAYWLERLDRAKIKFNLIIKPSAYLYVETVARNFTATREKDDINKEIVNLSRLHTTVQQYENEILQEAGVGPELEKVQVLSKKVTEVISWLEELLCQAMVDSKLFDNIYRHQQFMYQKE